MYDKIGGKIKGLAIFCAFSCVIIGVIVAIYGTAAYVDNKQYIEYARIYGGSTYNILMDAGDKAYYGLEMLKYGVITAVAGFLGSWPLYGFGELVENVDYIAHNMKTEYITDDLDKNEDA